MRYEYARDARRASPGTRWDQPLLAASATPTTATGPTRRSWSRWIRLRAAARPVLRLPGRVRDPHDAAVPRDPRRPRTRPTASPGRSREYRFGYEQAPFNGASLLARVDAGRHRRRPAPRHEPLPPLTFGYTAFEPQPRAGSARSPAPACRPRSLGDPTMALVDLRGNGLPDIVELGGTARYWRNRGDGRFDLPRAMTEAPPQRLGDPGVQLLDADGDGRADLLVTSRDRRRGYFPMTFAGGWSRRSFSRYRQAPTVSLDDPRRAAGRPRRRRADRRAALGRRAASAGSTTATRAGPGSAPRSSNGPTRRRRPGRPPRPAGGHDRRRPAGHRAAAQRQRRLLAEPRPRPLGVAGAACADAPRLPDGLRPAPGPARRRRRRRRRRPRLRRRRPGHCSGSTSRQRAGPRSRSSITGTPDVVGHRRRAARRPAGTGMAGLLWSRARRRRRPATLRFLDLTGGAQAVPARQRWTTTSAPLTTVEYAPSTRLLPRATRPTRRPGGGHRCRSRCRSSPGSRCTTQISARPADHRVPLPPRLLGRRRARVPRLRAWSSSSTPRRSTTAGCTPGAGRPRHSRRRR